MYRVFLSSTGRDLTEHRQKVFEALQRKPDVKVVRMEDFVAEDLAPKDLCDREVSASQIFVGLIGHCYGSSPPRYKRSFTHLEYLAAKRGQLPCLMHIAPGSFTIAAELIETDDLRKRVADFRSHLLTVHTVGQRQAWHTPDALAAHVSEAVERELDRLRKAMSEPGLTEAKYELQLKGRLAELVSLAASEIGEERNRLEQEKAAVEERLADLQTSYAQAQATIASLQETLEREGNHIEAERLERAEKALEQGDFDEADKLLAEIEA
ncbi:MAG: DUF4062 domain-containing protein, partial [Pseudomonadota bacterium]